MRPDVNDPSQDFTVEWYFVPKKTPTIGVETIFGSSIWDEYRFLPEHGELRDSRKWCPGGPPRWVPLEKPKLCGTPEQWLHGWSAGFTPCEVDPITGQCKCCGKVDRLGRHDTASGGRVVWHYLGGGASGGGIVEELRFLCSGGGASGGAPTTSGHYLCYGGSADGGTVNYDVTVPSYGGGASGGDITENPFLRCKGGSADGGTTTTGYGLVSDGGSADGGTSALVFPTTSEGGSADGGPATIVVAYSRGGGGASGGPGAEAVAFARGGGGASGGTSTVSPAHGGVQCPANHSILVDTHLRCRCTAADSGLSAFLSVDTTIVWNGASWTASVTVGGVAGSITMTPTGSNVELHGSSTPGPGTNWNFFSSLMGISPTCGPPFDAVFTNLSSGFGMSLGNTSWEVSTS